MSDAARQVTSADFSAEDADRLRDALRHRARIVVGDVEVPPSAVAFFVDALDALSEGRRLELVVVEDMLSTQEVAVLLRVSRPTVVKMLDDGLLPYERLRTHRRIPRDAVEVFLADRRRRRSQALDEMARTADPGDVDDAVSTR